MDMDLAGEIGQALNRACRENESNTPDFVLAEFLMGCLAAYEEAVIRRSQLRLGGPFEDAQP